MRSMVAAALSAVAVMSVGLAAQATVLERDRFKGSQVATSFSGSVALTCADGSEGTATASGFLSGASTLTKTKGAPRTETNGIFVDVTYSNSCTGVNVSFADGSIPDGLTPPRNKKLKDAALDGNGTVQDFGTGATLPISLAVDVEGTGDVNTSAASSHTTTVNTPGGTITVTITHSANANRSGTASGTVTIDGVVFTPDFFSTSLSLNRNSEIVIERP